jgi:hypothetical protein
VIEDLRSDRAQLSEKGDDPDSSEEDEVPEYVTQMVRRVLNIGILGDGADAEDVDFTPIFVGNLVRRTLDREIDLSALNPDPEAGQTRLLTPDALHEQLAGADEIDVVPDGDAHPAAERAEDLLASLDSGFDLDVSALSAVMTDLLDLVDAELSQGKDVNYLLTLIERIEARAEADIRNDEPVDSVTLTDDALASFPKTTEMSSIISEHEPQQAKPQEIPDLEAYSDDGFEAASP